MFCLIQIFSLQTFWRLFIFFFYIFLNFSKCVLKFKLLKPSEWHFLSSAIPRKNWNLVKGPFKSFLLRHAQIKTYKTIYYACSSSFSQRQAISYPMPFCETTFNMECFFSMGGCYQLCLKWCVWISR